MRKVCSKCKENKPIEDFNLNKRSIDGYQSYCRICMRAYSKDYNVEYLPKRRNGEQNLSGSRFYSIHYHMMDRCYNPNIKDYPNYGGRGISVCDRWHSFDNFYEDMFSKYEKGLTLERIDVNGNYCPENCTWVTLKDQARNRRDTNWITKPDGEKIQLVVLCEDMGLSYSLVKARYEKYGNNYYELVSDRKIREGVEVPFVFKKYVWENQNLKPSEYIEWLDRNFPDHGISKRYVTQLASDYRRGKKKLRVT